MFPKDFHFTELINLEEWQRLQDGLSDALEISLQTFSPDGQALSKTSRPNRLCKEILPRHKPELSSCASCLPSEVFKNLKEIRRQTEFKTIFDLDLFVIPISAVGDAPVVYLIAGPIMLMERKKIGDYAAEAKQLGIPLSELEDALVGIRVFSHSKIYTVINLISEVFSQIAHSAYHKKRLGEIRPEIVELDPLFSRYYEEKILTALLNTCALALNADSGSVMTLDRNTKMLHIKAARKLGEDIVHNTQIKMGEGIAGLAAATFKSIILPKDKEKSGVSERMKRKEINSSLIMPFPKANQADLYGVINLNIVRKGIDFSEKDIALVKELVNMASIALAPIKQPGTVCKIE